MNVLIVTTSIWHQKDFELTIKSLLQYTPEVDKLVFVQIDGTKRAVSNRINWMTNNLTETYKADSIEEAKTMFFNSPVVVIRRPTLFFFEWGRKILAGITEHGTDFNFVPSFVNSLDEQGSILNEVYPNQLLFDLDYKRDKMKLSNINYFNSLCQFQSKELEKWKDHIILYPTPQLKESKVICIFSCALAKLLR